MPKIGTTYQFVMVILGLGLTFSIAMFVFVTLNSTSQDSIKEIPSNEIQNNTELEQDNIELTSIEEDLIFAFSDNTEKNIFHLIKYSLEKNSSQETYIPKIPTGTKLPEKNNTIEFYTQKPLCIVHLQNKDDQNIQYWYQYAYESNQWTKVYETNQGITSWELNENFDQLILYTLDKIYTLPVKQNNTVEPRELLGTETAINLHSFNQEQNTGIIITEEKQGEKTTHSIQNLDLQTGELTSAEKIFTESEEIIGNTYSEHLSPNGQYYVYWKSENLNLYNKITKETTIITPEAPLIPNILWSNNSQKFAYLPEDQGVWIHNILTNKKAKILKQAPQQFVLWAHNKYIIHAQDNTLYSLNTLNGENVLIKGEEKLFKRLLGINE